MGLFNRIFSKKEELLDPIDLGLLSCDLHSHLIPGIDDGSPSVETSIELLKKFQDLGYHKVITTPHIMSDYYRNTPEIINTGLEDVRAAIIENKLSIKIEAAAEYNLEPNFVELLKSKNILTFGSEKYLLFELSFFNEPPNLNETIWSMREHGYCPVLAHVERYAYWHSNYDKIEEMINRGVKLQLNIGSLTGSYGPEVKDFAEKLVRDEVIDFVGSDCHHIQHLQMIDFAKKLPYFHQLIQQKQILNNQL
jgi:tyrosine-protein phosphatase YwqE